MDRGIRGAVTGAPRSNSRRQIMILFSLQYNCNSRRMAALKDKGMLRSYALSLTFVFMSALSNGPMICQRVTYPNCRARLNGSV